MAAGASEAVAVPAAMLPATDSGGGAGGSAGQPGGHRHTAGNE